MTTPREDAIAARRMRHVLEYIADSGLLDADEWLWLDKEVRAALGVEAETPVKRSSTESLGEWLNRQTIDAYLASPETAEALRTAIRATEHCERDCDDSQWGTCEHEVAAILAAMRETIP